MCERASNSGMLVRSRSVLCDELTAIVSVRLGSAIAGKGLLACTEVGPLDSPTVPWGSALHVSHHSYRVDERTGLCWKDAHFLLLKREQDGTVPEACRSPVRLQRNSRFIKSKLSA